MPHLLAADLAATDSPALRQLACDACWYLIARGDTRTAYDLARGLRQQWRDRLGEDHVHTLVRALPRLDAQEMGRYAEARDLDQDTLDRRRRVLGEDHPDTLYSAHNLATNLRQLGEVRAARDLARTPWTATAGSWARTTPALCVPPEFWLTTCACWVRCRPPVTWTRTPWTANAASWARTTPTP